MQSKATSPINNIAKLVEQEGSAAYLLYQQQSEKMLRDRLNEQNNGVYISNIEGFKMAQNESFARIMVSPNYRHADSFPVKVPQEDMSETALEKEIQRIVQLQ